ncbi:HipA domain-containing protein [Patulibacter sp. NPDC049589]|uniref:HipA domain-containing protein n=1 Tax=Patulibacter sp. NPDC049589 TaxID=3154731 RepID=UPI003422872B
MARATDLWLDGMLVAHAQSRDGAEVRIRYSRDAIERWPAFSPVLSCSLPLGPGRQDGTPFARGLLPEGAALAALAKEARVAQTSTFDLLRRFGRDVAGALVVSDDPPEARAGGVVPYAGDELEAAVADLDGHPLDLRDDSELSIAGFQDKLLLVARDDGSWGRPVGGRPSTHILKRDHPVHRGIVAAEAAALRLARAADLTTVTPQVVGLGGYDCLIVDRFDRRVTAAGTVRVHQEDLCQATGTDVEGDRGRAKYEGHGGPGFRALADLLDAYADEPVAQLRRLVRVMVFTVLIGNGDAHGKNLALLHPDPKSVELASLYDTVPTVLWPALKDRAAMHVAGRTTLSEVTAHDLVAEARSWRLSRTDATRQVRESCAMLADLVGVCGHRDLERQVTSRAATLGA